MNRKLAATYMIGYTVEKVVAHDQGFEIQFGKDRSIFSPEGATPQVNGLTLANVAYSEDTSETTLTFSGGVEVYLDPQTYSVTHPSVGTVFPERGDEEPSSLPPDPSSDRVADGPEDLS
jgi:hypothetical protein